jgi:hypothetical protein
VSRPRLGPLLVLGMFGSLFLLAPYAHATALSDQATHQRSACRHVKACWPNYTAAVIAVNASWLVPSVAQGVARATRSPVQRCGCRAGRILQSDQRVAAYSRRRFRDWWRNPGTGPGKRLRNCLLAAGGVLAAKVAELANGNGWDDRKTLLDMGAACGFAAWAAP